MEKTAKSPKRRSTDMHAPSLGLLVYNKHISKHPYPSDGRVSIHKAISDLGHDRGDAFIAMHPRSYMLVGPAESVRYCWLCTLTIGRAVIRRWPNT